MKKIRLGGLGLIVALLIVLLVSFMLDEPAVPCHDGIVYLRVGQGVTPKLDTDGNPVRCEAP